MWSVCQDCRMADMVSCRFPLGTWKDERCKMTSTTVWLRSIYQLNERLLAQAAQQKAAIYIANSLEPEACFRAISYLHVVFRTELEHFRVANEHSRPTNGATARHQTGFKIFNVVSHVPP